MKLVTQALRSIFLNGDVAAKAEAMKNWPVSLFPVADSDVREAFFAEVISTMEADQYEDVNRITPAVVKVQAAVPPALHAVYVKALLSQGGSGAFQGKPAALAALSKLPDELAKAGLAMLDAETLAWQPDLPYRTLVENHVPQWPEERKKLFSEFLELNIQEFVQRYIADETQERQ